MNGFEDDEHFFASYQPEAASSAQSQTDLEFEEQAPSEAQLAHWARFRRPVGSFVAAMALFSVVALVKRDSERGPEPPRELVAHLRAAVAAPTTPAPAVPPASGPAGLVPSELALRTSGMCPTSDAAPVGLVPRARLAQPYSNTVGVCSASPDPLRPMAGGARGPASQLAVR